MNSLVILTVVGLIIIGITFLITASATHYSGNPITSSPYEPILTLTEQSDGIHISWIYPELVAGNESLPVQNPTVRIERVEPCLTNPIFSGYEQYLLPHNTTSFRITSYCGSPTEGSYVNESSSGSPLENIEYKINLIVGISGYGVIETPSYSIILTGQGSQPTPSSLTITVEDSLSIQDDVIISKQTPSTDLEEVTKLRQEWEEFKIKWKSVFE